MANSINAIEKAKAKFKNETDFEFTDITCEEFREYHFPNGESLMIEDPVYLCMLETGENLLYTASGKCYKIRPSLSWYRVWKARAGCAHFVK